MKSTLNDINMRLKVLFFAIVLAVASVQTADAQSSFRSRPRGGYTSIQRLDTGFGVSFGWANSVYRTTEWSTDEVERDPALNGFYLGVTKDFTLIRHALFLQAGLYYTYLNDERNKELAAGIKVIGDRTEHLLNLPVRVKYSYQITPKIGVFAYAGPTFVAGLSSNLKYRAKLTEDHSVAASYGYYTGKVKSDDLPAAMQTWFDEQKPQSKYNRFDILMGGAIGAEFFKVLEVHLGYDWGLIDRLRGDIAEDFTMLRNQFYLSVGLRF